MTDSGIPAWTAPSGRTYPPIPRDITPPILPNHFTTPPPGLNDREAPEDRPWPTLPQDPDSDTWWQHLHQYLSEAGSETPERPYAEPDETATFHDKQPRSPYRQQPYAAWPAPGLVHTPTSTALHCPVGRNPG
ncbi:hypothetical protein [Paenarthrobacter sp. Z7-10]|uniref:hypothetical protein n=1 Tax=Paenarthrobacter sp. Z7-10 TaxID=2787635 RepID=UPI0022A97E27|nr:hypothetical protein [Paenarthrobacter sp. Z7-10]